MGKALQNYSREQQELLDSGLRMLAQMIAAAHLRRTAFRNALEDTVTTPDKRAPGALRKMPETSSKTGVVTHLAKTDVGGKIR